MRGFVLSCFYSETEKYYATVELMIDGVHFHTIAVELAARILLREASGEQMMSKLKAIFGQKINAEHLHTASDLVDRRIGEDSEMFRALKLNIQREAICRQRQIFFVNSGRKAAKTKILM